MSFWKQMSSGTRGLLGKARYVEIRGYAKKHNPTPVCSGKGKKKKGAEEVCVDNHPKPRRADNIEKTFPFYDLIKFKKECCDTGCPDKDFPSFDKCLYKESDKNKRKYQVTWVECPPVAIKPKKICCFAKTERPPFERRRPKFRPGTACIVPKCKDEELACPKLAMPGCKAVRDKVKCHRIRFPGDCVKIRAPYPSFSECAHPKLRKRRRSECHCWDEIPICDLYRELNKRLNSGRTNMNPCQKS